MRFAVPNPIWPMSSEKRLPQRENTCKDKEMAMDQAKTNEDREKMALSQPKKTISIETNPAGTLIFISSLQKFEKINAPCSHHLTSGPLQWLAQKSNIASKCKVGTRCSKPYVCSRHPQKAENSPSWLWAIMDAFYRCSQTTNSEKTANCSPNIFIHERTWREHICSTNITRWQRIYKVYNEQT